MDAAYGAQETWDFYKNVMGRNGIRNDGVGASSRTHYGNAYVNAFWQDSCFCMTYGDGSGDTHPLTSLDVAGHEMSHGVTAATASLNYTGESGGLNEATSDIFGTVVEFYANNAATPATTSSARRSTSTATARRCATWTSPRKDGDSKDCWSSGLGGLDVHYSSGPANHLFYLLSEGSGAKVVNGVELQQPDLRRPVGARHRPGQRRQALVQRPDRALHLDHQLRGAPAPRPCRPPPTCGAPAAPRTTRSPTPGPPSASAPRVTVTNPGGREHVVNTPASLQIQASSTNPGALTYSATGLPAGLSINACTGLISGTPTTVGLGTVTVTVKDSSNVTGTATFAWTVSTTGGNVFENTTDVPIPDAGAAVYSHINVTGRAGNAPSALKVDVNIVHPYRGDLVIDLVAPDGSLYRLKKSDGFDSPANVIATYTVNASSETAKGTWKLKVQDAYHLDRGYINSWNLTF